jgi:DNA-binding MarR family transcriptional regulator
MMDDASGAPRLDRMIHEPSRLRIMTLLFVAGSADFTYLLRECELSKGNLSVQLTRLDEAGYVKIEKGYRGKIPCTSASLTKTGRQAFRAYRTYLAGILKSTEGV